MNPASETRGVTSLFVEPVDVLFLRGNHLFGDAGSFGESMMPPWPSVLAGAIRSRILVDDKVDLAAYALNQVEHPALGTPVSPGKFMLDSTHIARRRGDGAEMEVLYPVPADLLVFDVLNNGVRRPIAIRPLRPTSLHSVLATSASVPQIPVMAGASGEKPARGWWLRQLGWLRYMQGQLPKLEDLVHASALWRTEDRVGVGLDPERRSVREGHLFSSRAIAPCEGVGFLVGVTGAKLPRDGNLRLGGDGRAARVQQVEFSWPEPDFERIAEQRRCRIVLTAPGIFAQGWSLPGIDEGLRVSLPGFSGHLVCAAMAGAATVSGWDLAKRQPKAAQKAVATGSVYWLDDVDSSPEDLQNLMKAGLWGESCEDPWRRAEGFNRFSFASF